VSEDGDDSRRRIPRLVSGRTPGELRIQDEIKGSDSRGRTMRKQ
jgi:hypothetical protein